MRLGKLCHFTKTATVSSMEHLCLKLQVANRSNHRLLKRQRRGMKQFEMREAGKQLKRERVTFEDKLSTLNLYPLTKPLPPPAFDEITPL